MARKPAQSIVAQSVKLDTTVNHETARRAAINAIHTAEGLATAALVGAVIATAEHGPTSKEEVAECWPTCNNPAVYASKFNQGAKVAALLGIDNAVAIIRDAESMNGGRAHERVGAALSSVIATAKESGKTKEGLTGKPARDAIRNAKAAALAASGPKAPKAPVKRGAAGSVQADDAALRKAQEESGRSWAHMARFLTMAAKAASRMERPVGREEKAKAAVQALVGVAGFFSEHFGD